MKQAGTLADRIIKLNQFWREVTVSDQDNPLLEEVIWEIIQYVPNVISCPKSTSVRIILNGKEFTQKKFLESASKSTSSICFDHNEVGIIELHYKETEKEKCLDDDLEVDKVVLEILGERLSSLSAIGNKNKEIERLKVEALTAYDRTIEAWAAAFETQHKEASGHTERVMNLALALAKEMGFEDEDLINIRRGALLHDIGKISIPDNIISKPGKLTEEEYQVVKRHPLFAKKWLSQIELLKPALQIPYYHHEKWDGTGYPLGMVGEEIPLVARLFSIVDVWDALTSDRPYRRALSKEEALNLIVSQSGAHFDPNVVESFIRVLAQGKYIDALHKLRIQALGGERVWSQNVLLATSDWQVHAAREMFFVFLAHPEGLTKEQVGLCMWPDASMDELDIRFKNTLYRLRSAIGKHVILLSDGSYRFNPILDYAYDVEIFTTALQRAQETDDVHQKIKHLSHAIQQYKGEYLPEIDAFWAIPDREKYRQMNIDALIQLATQYYEKGVYKSALKYCKQAIEEDIVREDAHRLAMRIHAETGNKVEVIRQFEACRNELMERYHVSPSEQTQELYETLVNFQS